MLKNNDALTTLLKTISTTIAKIKTEAKEAKNALDNIRKLYNQVK